MTHPIHLTFSPTEKALVYLHNDDHSTVRSVYISKEGQKGKPAFPDAPQADDSSLTIEEKLRRVYNIQIKNNKSFFSQYIYILQERQRVMGGGITSFVWVGDRILVPHPSGILIGDPVTGQLEMLFGRSVVDPQLTQDRRTLFFVLDGELHALHLTAEGRASGDPVKLTASPRAGVTNGLAEYVAQEEMDRPTGFWPEPAGQLVAFAEVDETHIPPFTISHYDLQDPYKCEVHRYPFAGKENAKVRLGVVSTLAPHSPVWITSVGPGQEFEYLARVHWLPDRRLAVQLQNRSQNLVEVRVYDPLSGALLKVLTRETSATWTNLHNIFRSVEVSGRRKVLWASERTGFRHLYLIDDPAPAAEPAVPDVQVTGGEWQVDSVAAVDEGKGLVYFHGNPGNPTEQHLLTASLNPGAAGPQDPPHHRLTAEPGFHNTVVSVALGLFADSFSSVSSPPRTQVRSLSSGAEAWSVYEPSDPRLKTVPLRIPTLETVTTPDGWTLHAAVFAAAEEDPAAARPPALLVSVYGGPHVQRVQNSWATTVEMRAQMLCSLGHVVAKVDGRGSARRGLRFESQLHRRMGTVEVDDQVALVQHLCSQNRCDRSRVGMYGWSYGGYMSALALLRAPEVFKVGIAGAPVTFWQGYDTHYTERYMGMPEDNKEGYLVGAVTTHVDKLTAQQRLLLIHGCMDENVHVRHTMVLANTLNRAQKPFDLIILPNERHSPRRLEDKIHMEKALLGFLEQWL
jgi:dipeptidyl-peptidase-4